MRSLEEIKRETSEAVIKEMQEEMEDVGITKVYCGNCGYVHEFVGTPGWLLKTEILATRRNYLCEEVTDKMCKTLSIPSKFIGETIVCEDIQREIFGFKCALCKEETILYTYDNIYQGLITPTDISGEERFELSMGPRISGHIYACDLNHPKWKFNQKNKNKK